MPTTGSSGSGKGLARYVDVMAPRKNPPVASDFSFEHEGDPLKYSKFVSRQTGNVDGILIEGAKFSVCPICFDPEPSVAEHVPPVSLGGRVMTWTCPKCNNDFGPAENQLRSFIDLETTAHAEAADGSVSGRRAAKVALRSSEGRPSGMFIRSAAPGFEEALNSGSGKLTVNPLDMEQVTAAVLKHAYLAACLHQLVVPESPDVQRVRAVLLAARSRDKLALNAALMELQKTDALPAYGWVVATSAPTIFLFEGELRGKGTGKRWMFMLGGRFGVEWPFPDVAPRAALVAAVANQLDDESDQQNDDQDAS